VASFYPLYEFSRQVAGHRADVVSLVPPGAEPHDWEPSPRDVARLAKATLFVYNGAGFDPWADRLLASLPAGGPQVVKATDGIALLPVDLPGHASGHRHGPDHRHASAEPMTRAAASASDGGGRDPHVWLDPRLAQQQVDRIRAALAGADPAGAAAYTENARTYTARLAELDQAMEAGLASCQRRDMIVSHAAFGYLARRYRLTQVPVMGLSPDAEPSPAALAALVRRARRQQVKYIFFETLVSGRLADTLAREVGARTLLLNPVEGVTEDEAAAGKGYVALMEENLGNLRVGLGCS
jgi:zinc transport system substrate-binding protein